MNRQFTLAGSSVVVIEETPDGCFLFEFRSDGFIADTWHLTIADAKIQAAYAFGSNLIPTWTPVPAHVTDLNAFALTTAPRRSLW